MLHSNTRFSQLCNFLEIFFPKTLLHATWKMMIIELCVEEMHNSCVDTHLWRSEQPPDLTSSVLLDTE